MSGRMINVDKKDIKREPEKVAPGLDEEDSFGKDASKSDKEKGETTKVTRMIYDEYEPS